VIFSLIMTMIVIVITIVLVLFAIITMIVVVVHQCRRSSVRCRDRDDRRGRPVPARYSPRVLTTP